MEELRNEHDHLKKYIREHAWNESTGFLHDVLHTGETSSTYSIGAFWTLLADLFHIKEDEEKIDSICARLEDERHFCRPHQVPTLSASDKAYNPKGGYWCGGKLVS